MHVIICEFTDLTGIVPESESLGREHDLTLLRLLTTLLKILRQRQQL